MTIQNVCAVDDDATEIFSGSSVHSAGNLDEVLVRRASSEVSKGHSSRIITADFANSKLNFIRKILYG